MATPLISWRGQLKDLQGYLEFLESQDCQCEDSWYSTGPQNSCPNKSDREVDTDYGRYNVCRDCATTHWEPVILRTLRSTGVA